MKPLMTLAVTALCLASPAVARADERKVTYSGAAATNVLSAIKASEGWAIVSARQKVSLVAGLPAVDCVRYRVAVKYTARQQRDRNGNPENVVEVTFGPETDWIATDLKMPTTSGTSLNTARSANRAISELDTVIPTLERGAARETDPTVRAEGAKLIAALKRQRNALAGLIQMDVTAATSLSK